MNRSDRDGTSRKTRFAIDAVTAVRLVREDPAAGAHVPLVAPAALRSHAMSILYRDTDAGLLDEKTARALLERVATLKVRLLGDRVSRATAWKVARQLGWHDTGQAEYLAVATLQADVLVAGDRDIAAAAQGLVPLATYDDLRRA